jgi:hypothetical protein
MADKSMSGTGMSDDMRQRYEELLSREADGSLDDRGRKELSDMRSDLGIME